MEKNKPAEFDLPPNQALTEPVLREIEIQMRYPGKRTEEKPYLCVSLECLEEILLQENGLLDGDDVANFLEMLLIRAHQGAAAAKTREDHLATKLWRAAVDNRREQED